MTVEKISRFGFYFYYLAFLQLAVAFQCSVKNHTNYASLSMKKKMQYKILKCVYNLQNRKKEKENPFRNGMFGLQAGQWLLQDRTCIVWIDRYLFYWIYNIYSTITLVLADRDMFISYFIYFTSSWGRLANCIF